MKDIKMAYHFNHEDYEITFVWLMKSNVMSTQIGHFVTGCLGRKMAMQVEDGKQQNSEHSLVSH